MPAWTDDVAMAASAAQLASGYLERAERGGEPGASAMVLIEQAEGELERAGRFIANARRVLAHAA